MRGRLHALQRPLAVVRGALHVLHCRLAVMRGCGSRVGGLLAVLRSGFALGLAVPVAVGFAHGVLTEVVEVFADVLDEGEGRLAVEVHGEVGVGEEYHGGVGLVGLGTGGLELAQHQFGALVVARGEDVAHLVVSVAQSFVDGEEAEGAQLVGEGSEVLQQVVEEGAFLHVVFAGGDFVVFHHFLQGVGQRGGLGDGEGGIGVHRVAERGVQAVAFLVGLAEGGGVVAGAILLEGFVLAFEGAAELVGGLVPGSVVQRRFVQTAEDGGHVLEMCRIGSTRHRNGVNLKWKLDHNLFEF